MANPTKHIYRNRTVICLFKYVHTLVVVLCIAPYVSASAISPVSPVHTLDLAMNLAVAGQHQPSLSAWFSLGLTLNHLGRPAQSSPARESRYREI